MHFCSCEKEAITITRYGFWPATPEQPKVAFEIDFMELATVLQLESHLPIRSFCDALQFMNRFRIHDVKQVRYFCSFRPLSGFERWIFFIFI